jgi:hypothetical protein
MSLCGNKEGRHMAFNKKAVYLPGNEIYLYSMILNGVLINLPLKGKLHLNFQQYFDLYFLTSSADTFRAILIRQTTR